jgi:zinc/manganese transport system ATP-binding protein
LQSSCIITPNEKPPPRIFGFIGPGPFAARRTRFAAGVAGRGLGRWRHAVVTLDGLTVTYRDRPTLHAVSGCFAPGSLTAVVGPNGAGKSTLLKSILSLLPVAQGGLTVSTPRERIAYLPQQSAIDRSFPITVLDCVLLGAWQAAGAWGGLDSAVQDAADAALHTVGLCGFAQRPIGALSSGQFQRVLFARLLLQDADLILLDEPFNAIDSKTTAELLALVADWHARQRTVIAVLHDHAQVHRHFPQTLLLARGVVAWGETAQVMTPQHLGQARLLGESWDDHAH